MLPDQRIIVALDTPTPAEGRALVAAIGDTVGFYKIGLELFAAGAGLGLAQELMAAGNEVFVDMKFLDIPATVARAAKKISDCKARFQTVHAQDDALKAAVDASVNTGILAVTLLTSVTPAELARQGHHGPVEDYVVAKATRAMELGCVGVVCSPREAAAVRAAIGPAAKIVSPGVRDATAAPDDQARTASIADALAAGADHVVVGRQVRDAPDPRAAVMALLKQITG